MSGKKGSKHFTAALKTQIEEMKASGKTHREIAASLGMRQTQIKEYFHRKNRKERMIAQGVLLRPKGRPRTTTQTPEARILELEREVELLRSFLHAAGRM